MKTINELQDRRATLVRGIDAIRAQKSCTKAGFRVIKQYTKEIKLVDLCIRYVETGPLDEFVRLSIDRLKREIEVLGERFANWDAPKDRKFKDTSAERAFYNKTVGITTRKQQLQTLKYLL